MKFDGKKQFSGFVVFLRLHSFVRANISDAFGEEKEDTRCILLLFRFDGPAASSVMDFNTIYVASARRCHRHRRHRLTSFCFFRFPHFLRYDNSFRRLGVAVSRNASNICRRVTRQLCICE